MKPFQNYRVITMYLIISLLAGKPLNAQPLYFDSPVKLHDAVNSSGEEAKPFLSPDGAVLYFSRAFSPDNTGGNKAGLDIWYSRKDENGKWALPEEVNLPFQFKGDFHEFYIVPSEDILFVSMAGDNSFGQEDIYVSLRDTQGNWGSLINLGNVVNTPGFEISPFCTVNKDTLFFAGNGHNGYGDADIFMAVRLDSTWQHWSMPVNLGNGINSPAFDAYFYLAANGKAFFTSNREGEWADIYSTSRIQPEITSEPVASIADSIMKARMQDSVLRMVRQQELKRADSIAREELTNTLSDFLLYFNFDSFNLQTSQENRLDSLTVMVGKINNIEIKVTGHTDTIGSEAYNLELSRKRAEAVSGYLINRGILESRVKPESKGETDPVVDNATAKGRAQNRRVVITMGKP